MRPADLNVLIGLLSDVITEAGNHQPIATATPGGNQQPTPTATPAALAATPPANQKSALLIAHVTGGLAGEDNYVYLLHDGTAYVSIARPQTNTSFKVGDAQWATILSAAGAIDWAGSPDSYQPTMNVADGESMETIFLGDGFAKSVRTETGSDEPAELSRLEGLLKQLIANAQTLAGAPATAPAVGKSLLLLDYQASGGYVSRDIRVLVLNDGTVWLNERTPTQNKLYKLPADLWAQTQQDIAAIDWAGLKPNYSPDAQVDDGITIQLTYLGTDGHYTVRAATGGQPPAALDALLVTMQTIMAAGLP